MHHPDGGSSCCCRSNDATGTKMAEENKSWWARSAREKWIKDAQSEGRVASFFGGKSGKGGVKDRCAVDLAERSRCSVSKWKSLYVWVSKGVYKQTTGG